jgi:hypothetical protein
MNIRAWEEFDFRKVQIRTSAKPGTNVHKLSTVQIYKGSLEIIFRDAPNYDNQLEIETQFENLTIHLGDLTPISSG